MEIEGQESSGVQETTVPHEATETQENTAQDATPSAESTETKPEGFDKVEFTPEQLARVNRIYGNMKRYENDSKEQRELNQALVRELTNIRTEQSHIVTHLQTADFKDAETKLSQRRTEAWNKGDLEGYNRANDEMVEIRLKKELAKNRQPPVQQQPIQQQRSLDGNRVVDGARDKGDITPEEAGIAQSWMAETDQNGNPKRPWATNPSDPRNYAAALEAQAVFNSPSFVNKSIADKLREVDRRMGVQTQAGRTNVLPSGNLTNPAKTNNIKLDPAIEKIAIRTKFGGSKAKSDQDHVEAWKRAVAKSGGRK